MFSRSIPLVLASTAMGILLGARPGSAQFTPALATQDFLPAWTDTVTAGRFDNGKMWTFEFPPMDYFQEAYGISTDAAWFERARLGALRIPSCSASFVSPTGLVMTNHHCAREAISSVSRPGESLLDDGFLAVSQADERRIDDYYAEQLIEIRDVTAEVDAAVERAGGGSDARSQARAAAGEEITERLLAELGGEDAGFAVEVISLYNGGQTSAYIFRRYDDVRLVFAPELMIGAFGGDYDNFTYPRYNLDMSLYRVYGEDGLPLQTEHYFPFSDDDLEEGDVVFVVGNPGSTSRLQTVAELEFRRDVSDRALLDFIESRVDALSEFIEEDPEAAEALDLRNQLASLTNSQKAYAGQIAGLEDPYILARRSVQERAFHEAIHQDPVLRDAYGDLIDRMGTIQEQKRQFAAEYGAFLAPETPEFASATLVRALLVFQYLAVRSGGGPEELLEELRQEILAQPQFPLAFEELLIRARLDDFVRSWGLESPIVQGVLRSRSPEGLAAVIVNNSILADSAATAEALEADQIRMEDPAVQVIQGVLPRVAAFQGVLGQFQPEEAEIQAALGRARFMVYGTDVPPDATFSLRIADGVVRGYDYNGTHAPAFTTFWGLYDRHYSHVGREDWALPERWIDPSSAFDPGTPFNFVATLDIIGGNSGSPILNADLEVVGLVFDGNIESLPGDYIFLEDGPRAISVDARGILAALEHVYGAGRIVSELKAGVTAGAR
jgi:sulfur carrier protein ThiS